MGSLSPPCGLAGTVPLHRALGLPASEGLSQKNHEDKGESRGSGEAGGRPGGWTERDIGSEPPPSGMAGPGT